LAALPLYRRLRCRGFLVRPDVHRRREIAAHVPVAREEIRSAPAPRSALILKVVADVSRRILSDCNPRGFKSATSISAGGVIYFPPNNWPSRILETYRVWPRHRRVAAG